jgi:hypothetical protein
MRDVDGDERDVDAVSRGRLDGVGIDVAPSGTSSNAGGYPSAGPSSGGKSPFVSYSTLPVDVPRLSRVSVDSVVSSAVGEAPPRSRQPATLAAPATLASRDRRFIPVRASDLPHLSRM